MKDKKVRRSLWGAFWKLHDCKKKLKDWLEGLPPRARKRIVLAMFALFAALALYTFGKSLYDLGRNDGRQMETGHIRQLELPKEKRTDFLIPDENGTTEE